MFAWRKLLGECVNADNGFIGKRISVLVYLTWYEMHDGKEKEKTLLSRYFTLLEYQSM